MKIDTRYLSACPPDERIRCVICGGMLSVASADIVGLGYRCRPCSLRAELDGTEELAHLMPDERARVPREPASWLYLLAGVAVLVVATLMWIAKVDIRFGRGSLFVYMFIFGVGFVGLAWFRWLDRR